ncbi:hypothetical protein D8I24_2272 (plasmid) [Cupriavidus necator H850]|uniref:MarR family winged helix-turn-helix transcriptional regulator n=1 Tax=Cupriavidus necator TaxID=106590 RepID=UPI00129D6A03|nr:MarR family transcriptional regulator [Cupriavidus necator]KAI3605924.1 hypothetical protein D8I24_2272 [Cupriavidus necator H850]
MSCDIFQRLTLGRNQLARRIQRALEPWELSTMQFYALEAIATSRACMPSQCCTLLGLDPGALTRIIDKLEARQLVARDRSGPDRRVVKLQILRAGKQTYLETCVVVERVQEEFLALLPALDVNHLARLLDGLCGTG